MMHTGKRAIVVGASIGGLMAARALSDHYEEVTIVERDALGDSREPRKGVPQGRHAHGLLARGSRTLEQLFPGFTDEILAEGARSSDIVNGCMWSNFGAVLKMATSDVRGFLVSRPTLENAVRRRVARLPNVRLRASTEAVEPEFDARRGRVTGLLMRPVGQSARGETLSADLIVDASGRGARSPAWLERMGYTKPVEEAVRVDIGYMTRVYKRKPEHLPGLEAVLVAACPPDWRVGVILAQDGDCWIVTLGGYFGDRVPDDPAGFLAFAGSLQRREIYDVIKDAEPLTDPTPYTFNASLRRRYERLARFPEGFLVFGDALCSFNPIYGQGMSVAAIEALALSQCLAQGEANLAGGFFAAAAKTIDVPWRMAVGADLAHPGVEGPRPIPVRFINWYISNLFRAGAYDPALATRFLEVSNLLRPPPSLFEPAIAWRVWRGRKPKRPTESLVAPSFST